MAKRVTAPSDCTTSKEFVARLKDLHASHDGEPIPMRDLFALAKEFIATPLDEIERLLDRADSESRVGAVSIMDFQARSKKTTADDRRGLYELYLRRHDRINTWDLVDRAAPYVVGGYLDDKPRKPLYTLAKSKHWYERRTAIVATYFFIRQDDLDDTFAVADLLANDDVELVQKAVGGWVREAGKRDPDRLRAYLDKHAATMPRVALRFAIEKLDATERKHYLELATSSR